MGGTTTDTYNMCKLNQMTTSITHRETIYSSIRYDNYEKPVQTQQILYSENISKQKKYKSEKCF
jgi:hypothetical protein